MQIYTHTYKYEYRMCVRYLFLFLFYFIIFAIINYIFMFLTIFMFLIKYHTCFIYFLFLKCEINMYNTRHRQNISTITKNHKKCKFSGRLNKVITLNFLCFGDFQWLQRRFVRRILLVQNCELIASEHLLHDELFLPQNASFEW